MNNAYWTGKRPSSTVALHRQKGGLGVGKTKRGKGSKWMVVVDGKGIPLGSTTTSASPHEVTLVYKV